MKKELTLGYYKDENGNVGDDLNPWLWPKMLSNINWSENSEDVFIGVGSILDKRFDAFKKKIVVGAGARSMDELPVINKDWNILFVRGPRTQKALENQINVRFITDPAILIGDFYTQRPDASDIGLIPYFRSDQKHWRHIADRLGYRFISPCSPVEQFSKSISECAYVLTEAMHGAIFADSIRVPWYPISSSTKVYEGDTHFFKWCDWTESMDIKFMEKVLPMIWASDNAIKKWGKFKVIAMMLSRIEKDDCFLSKESIFQNKKREIKLVLQDFDDYCHL